jgi:hypothetical protein
MPKSKIKKVLVPKLDADTVNKLQEQLDAEESEVQNYEDQMEAELNQVGLDDNFVEEISKQVEEKTTDSKDLKPTRRDA